MTYRPQMTSFTRGIRVTRPLSWRGWDQVVADVWTARAETGAEGHYLSPDPRIVVFLDDGAQRIELSERADFTSALPQAAALFVPGGVPLWSRFAVGHGFRHLDIHMPQEALTARLGTVARQVDIRNPVLLPEPRGLLPLARLIAEECETGRHHTQYLDGLLQALLVDLFAVGPDTPLALDGPDLARAALSPAQIRRLGAALACRPERNLANRELAAEVGLSEGWFAHAFKQTTGQTPQRWQLEQRISRVMREMRESPGQSLAELAAGNGFADQAQLTRGFKAVTGTTPAVWRRAWT